MTSEGTLLKRIKSLTRSSLALWCRATESMAAIAEEHDEMIMALNTIAMTREPTQKIISSMRQGVISMGIRPVNRPMAKTKHSIHLRATPSGPSCVAASSSSSG